jgi:AAA domain
VVYCAFEGAHGYKKRAEALRRYHEVPDSEDVPLYLVPGRANMIKEHPLLISAVREQLMGELPRTVVLDTLNKRLVGSESKDVDMSAYIVAAEALRDAFDCVVMIIHHCGYDETHPRGHTSLTGAVDAEFEVVREGMLVTVKNVTMRDGPEGFEIRSAAEIVEVGEDVNGKVLTSLVIVPTDAPVSTARKKAGRPNVGGPTLTEALRLALADKGMPFRPVSGRAAEHAVREEEVRRRFDDAYPAGEATPEKIREATDTAYRRALHAACAEQKIGKGTDSGGNVMLWFKVSLPG